MSRPIIRVSQLSKRYQIGAREQAYGTFRDALTDLAMLPMRRLRQLRGEVSETETFWALRDVNFEVMPGEVVGVIGRNGAGKSTLLKILSRITEPTTGRVELWGRLASLLEVGTGFHAELSGRENIYLNGAILGMSRQEIQRKFDAIVDFSGVEKFLDTPVKRYSSGMYVRLAFAVAAHLEPDILLVDEVLAVGDVQFQKKCLGKMEEVARDGRTVLFVSHNLSAVSTLCSSGIWLKEGQFMQQGSVADILSLYRQEISSAAGSRKKSTRQLQVTAVRLVQDEKQSQTNELTGDTTYGPFDSCTLEAEFETTIAISDLEVNLIVQDTQGRNCIHLRTDFDGLHPSFKPGRHRIRVTVESLNLESQVYFAWLRLVCRDAELIVADSEGIPLAVYTGWDRHENTQPVVAVRRRWEWETL